MTNEEAYNKMAEGYAVTHQSFRNGEFLYMDDSYIIRDEEGNEFESDWDIKNKDPMWATNWGIYKGKKCNSHMKALYNSPSSIGLPQFNIQQNKQAINNTGKKIIDESLYEYENDAYYHDIEERGIVEKDKKKERKRRIFFFIYFVSIVIIIKILTAKLPALNVLGIYMMMMLSGVGLLIASAKDDI